MRIYHGTSFENACQILSNKVWELPYGKTIQNNIHFYQQQGIDMKEDWFAPTQSNLEQWGKVHFTTDLETAISYAKKHKRGVVLYIDDDKVTKPCNDFYITAVIYKTKDVYVYDPIGLKDLSYRCYWMLQVLYKTKSRCNGFITTGINNNAPSLVSWNSKQEAKKLALEILEHAKVKLTGLDLVRDYTKIFEFK